MSMNWEHVLWGVALFVTTFVISLVVVGVLLAYLPQNYFAKDRPDPIQTSRHPVVRILLRVLKNLLGVALVLLGIVLSVPGIPGQGALTVLIGIMLLDFPGKRQLECSFVARPRVFRLVNRLRARFNKPPLIVDLDQADATSRESAAG